MPGDTQQTTPPRTPVYRCAECGAVWRTEKQSDLCCTRPAASALRRPGAAG